MVQEESWKESKQVTDSTSANNNKNSDVLKMSILVMFLWRNIIWWKNFQSRMNFLNKIWLPN